MSAHGFDNSGVGRVIDSVRQVEGGAYHRKSSDGYYPHATDEVWCEVISVAEDWVVCRRLDLTDNTDSSLDFKVAKMLELQVSFTDGETIKTADDDDELYTVSHNADPTLQKRTLTKVSDDTTEDQVIVPRYVSRDTIADEDSGEDVVYHGSYIRARRPPCGTRTVDDDGVAIGWIDESPRAWAKAQ